MYRSKAVYFSLVLKSAEQSV
uniref:Uncharacterized protein n=1 Tax=Arundo donax TaxID=35708 RepID=A0A0A9G0S1_ARUDO